jgi:HTH-type transcriptional regulator / antitoxin HigA
MTAGTGIIDLDEKTYGQLLRRTLPHVIRTGEEWERFSSELLRPDELEQASREEKELTELLTVLIEAYEARRYPIRNAGPQQVLHHLMEARGLTQKDLWKVFGSKGITSEVFHGSAPSARLRQKSSPYSSTSAPICSLLTSFFSLYPTHARNIQTVPSKGGGWSRV